jgi:hypothetical protein
MGCINPLLKGERFRRSGFRCLRLLHLAVELFLLSTEQGRMSSVLRLIRNLFLNTLMSHHRLA